MAVQSTAPATSVAGYNCARVDTIPAIYNTPVLCLPPPPINFLLFSSRTSVFFLKDLLEEESVLHCEIGAYITVCYARHVTSRHVTSRLIRRREGQKGGWEEAGGGTGTGSVDAPG